MIVIWEGRGGQHRMRYQYVGGMFGIRSASLFSSGATPPCLHPVLIGLGMGVDDEWLRLMKVAFLCCGSEVVRLAFCSGSDRLRCSTWCFGDAGGIFSPPNSLVATPQAHACPTYYPCRCDARVTFANASRDLHCTPRLLPGGTKSRDNML